MTPEDGRVRVGGPRIADRSCEHRAFADAPAGCADTVDTERCEILAVDPCTRFVRFHCWHEDSAKKEKPVGELHGVSVKPVATPRP